MPRENNGSYTHPAPKTTRSVQRREPYVAVFLDEKTGQRVESPAPVRLSCREPRARLAFRRLQAIYGRSAVRLVEPTRKAEAKARRAAALTEAIKALALVNAVAEARRA